MTDHIHRGIMGFLVMVMGTIVLGLAAYAVRWAYREQALAAYFAVSVLGFFGLCYLVGAFLDEVGLI